MSVRCHISDLAKVVRICPKNLMKDLREIRKIEISILETVHLRDSLQIRFLRPKLDTLGLG